MSTTEEVTLASDDQASGLEEPRLRYTLMTSAALSKRARHSVVNVIFEETNNSAKCIVYDSLPLNWHDPMNVLLHGLEKDSLKVPNMVMLMKYRLPANIKGWKSHIFDMGGMMAESWDSDEQVACMKYEQAVSDIFAGISAACAQSHVWIITYGRATARILEAGLAELQRLDPQLRKAVKILCLTSMEREPFASQASLLKEADAKNQTICIGVKKTSRIAYDHEVSPHSTHILVFPKEEHTQEFASYLQAEFPSVHLHTCGTEEERVQGVGGFFSNVVNHAKKGSLVVNFADMHFNPTYFSALLLSEGRGRVAPEDLETLRQLSVREIERPGNNFKPKAHMRQKLEKHSFSQCLNDTESPADLWRQSLEIMYQEHKEDLKSTKELVRVLPRDTPYHMFVTIDTMQETYVEVVEKLMVHMATSRRFTQDLIVGNRAASKNILNKAWLMHDQLEQLADRCQKRAYITQLAISIASILVTVFVCLQAEMNMGAAVSTSAYFKKVLQDHAFSIKITIMILPVLITVIISYQEQTNNMMKWALCRQARIRVEHGIYSFQTFTGKFQADRIVKTASASHVGFNTAARNDLALLLTEVERDLRSSVLVEYSWDWDLMADIDMPDMEGGFLEEPAPEPADDGQVPPLGEAQHLLTKACTGYGTSSASPESVKQRRSVARHALHLTGDEYMHSCLLPLMVEFQEKSERLYQGLWILRILVLLSTGCATLLAALNFMDWVTVAVALGITFQRWIDFQALPQRLANVNLSIAALRAQVVWWRSLAFVARVQPDNLQKLVDAVENNADAETAAILKSIKSADSASRAVQQVQHQTTQAVKAGSKLSKGGIGVTFGV